MGITGLLPALKPIQVTRHLSHFSGQTIAVDAYVWLHKGIYTCATELATGKPTHKYVDYAMHRVRLLRYYNIEPYIVFDGGPLPAKRGTELDRKQRRNEYLSKGSVLAAQGKHAQARDCYVKCVDVTPQMAYQLIKALRAENVPYIVAPYEADAQLAYLERVGSADAILTEDSDLLVYGCRTVLFKLDTVAATAVSVSRKDFGSIALPLSEISLVGWSDVQFRAMAILSGCDYLPSIPGIGLKTACSLLRKWKTVEQVVRVLMLEGKKSVPKDYLRHFQKAERCFLHQRVYCPSRGKLVHLTEIDGGEWDDECDTYIGRSIDPDSARRVAQGDIDPVSLLPMNDINPSYVPTPSKHSVNTTRLRPNNSKGKTREVSEATPKSGSILDFFGPSTPVTPLSGAGSKTSRSLSPATIPRTNSKGNGKRTLADIMEQDIALRKEKKRVESDTSAFADSLHDQGVLTQSKFFANAIKRGTPLSTGSLMAEKENIFCTTDSYQQSDRPERMIDDEAVPEASNHADAGSELIDLTIAQEETVQQEKGYISPIDEGNDEIEAPELSSPVRPLKKRKGRAPADSHLTPKTVEYITDEEDFGAETLSSPPAAAKTWTVSNIFKQWEYRGDKEADSVTRGIERRHSFPFPSLQRAKNDPTLCPTAEDTEQGENLEGKPYPSCSLRNEPDVPGNKPREGTQRIFPDLFLDDVTEDLTIDEDMDHGGGTSSSTPSASPDTPEDRASVSLTSMGGHDDVEILEEDVERLADDARAKVVMDGWRARWARQAPQAPFPQPAKSPRKTPKSRAFGSVRAFPSSSPKPHRTHLGTPNLKRSETNITPGGRHSLETARSQLRHVHLALGRTALAAGSCTVDLTSADEDREGEATVEVQSALNRLWKG